MLCSKRKNADPKGFFMEKRMPWPCCQPVSVRLFLLSPFTDLETNRNYSIVLVVSPPNALVSEPGD